MSVSIRRVRCMTPAPAIGLLACLVAAAMVSLFASPGAFARPHDHSSAAAPDRQAYLGTWKAKFHGQVFAILVLQEKDGYLEGTLNNFAVAYDRQGHLTDGTHIDVGVSPIISPRFQDGKLMFTVAQKDAYSQTTDWSFVVISKRQGELTENMENQLETPTSMVVKPIPMFRTSKR